MDTEVGPPNPLTFPPVIKYVFKYLSAKALCNIASVCSLWRDHAQRCQEQRQQYCWQFFEHQGPQATVQDMMHQYIEELAFRPTVVIVFMTCQQWELLAASPRCHSGVKRRKRSDSASHSAWKYFCQKNLPPDCQAFISVTSGIVGTSSDLSMTVEKESGSLRCATLLCFGKYPALQVRIKKSSERGCLHAARNKEDNDGNSRCCSSGSAEDSDSVGNEKLLLLMVGHDGARGAARDLSQKLPHTLTVGGIVYCSCLHGGTTNCSRSVVPYCIEFCGGSDVQVACVKLDDSISEEDKAEEVILRLKDKAATFNLRHSLAFMFACVARGHSLYSKHNVEASLFRRHFPITPLLGLFGNGEIGCEFPLESGVTVQAKDLMNVYTTFIVVISLP